MATKTRLKKKPVGIPIIGDAAHNHGFLIAIGGLVVAWANNESVFLALLQALIHGGQLSASVIWHSLRTTNARLELVDRLSREQVTDAALLKDVQRAIDQFKGFSRTRHFFCHATYNYDNERHLASATGASVTQEGEPIRFVTKPMDRATINEIGDATVKLASFNRELWALVPRIEAALGVRRVKLPSFPPEK